MHPAGSPSNRPLHGRVALVAGATRGAGRGTAIALGELGATVYCTGRSSRARPRPERPADASPFEPSLRPETIEETAELVTAAGGEGVAVQVDHADPAAVEALARRVEATHGRLDVLVDDVWGGDVYMEWQKPLWELDLARGRAMLETGLLTHVVTCRHLVPLVLRSERGLVVEVTDGDSLAYRGSYFYDLVKTSVIRLAFALAEELRPRSVTALAVTPGFLRSEAVLEYFGVTRETWRDGVAKDPHFAYSESPRLVGRGIAALAADPRVFERTGAVLSSWALAREYQLTDEDGSRPDWGAHAADEPFFLDQQASAARFLGGFAGPRRG